MNILWFLFWVKNTSGKLSSPFPSTRIRGLNLIDGMNHEIKVVPLDKSRIPLSLTDESLGLTSQDLARCDVAIFGKLLNEVLPLVEDLSARDIPFIIDVCDIMKVPNVTYYSHLFQQAAGIVSASGPIQDQLSDIDVPSVCIPDAQPGLPKPFSADESDKLRVLWFGMSHNIVPLLSVIDELAASFDQGMRLAILGNTNDSYLTDHVAPYLTKYPGHLDVYLHQWSLSAMDEFLAMCDVVIIPSSEHEFHNAKTANRLMTAIWAGKSCVAFPVLSYLEFADFVELNASMTDGIKAMLDRPVKVREQMVSDGQTYIAAHHSVEARTIQWNAVLEDAVQNRQVEPLLKLNLVENDCGQDLSGYTSVLLDPISKDGARDAANLAGFKDNTASEILCVDHIQDYSGSGLCTLVRESVRVLKPGGRLVVEFANPGPDHDALAPNGLARLFTECGLIEIKQTPALFMPEVQGNCRLVAIKPFTSAGAAIEYLTS